MRKIFQLACAALLVSDVISAQLTVITNVNVVDVEKSVILPNRHVIIDGNRISRINTGSYTPPAGAKIINGNNKFLIPGLWDMHTHNWNTEQFFPLLIANGITGIRDMFTMSWSMLQGWKRDIAAGKFPGPIIYGSGPIVDGPKPVWPGSVAVKDSIDGVKAVDSLRNKLGVDFIKVYSLLPRDGYFAIAAAAKKNNIPFAGHVPNLVTALEAAEAGQKSQEHLYGLLMMASDSADYLMKVVQGKINDTTLASRPARTRMMFRTYNPGKMEELAKQLAKYGTWICPTLTVNRSIAHLDDSSFVKDDRLDYMGAYMRDFWNPKKDFRFRDQPADYFEMQKKDYAIKLQMIPILQRNGVRLLAGTDYPNPYCFPGFSLHDELMLMTNAGLTPAQALQTATINPAIYLGLQKDLGTIAPGKIANLVLLDKNPLIDINATRQIQTVILSGKTYNKQELDKMLHTVKDKYKL